MPYYLIDRATNFIVEDESWTVVEYDRSSVPGIIYLSLTETKVNMIYDDLKNDIADLDKLAVYDLSIPDITQIFHINDEINLVFTLTKNGVPCGEEVEFISSDKKIVKNINGKLKAVGEGTVDIIVQLKQYPAIQKIINITVSSENKEFSAYIEGPSSIKLAYDGEYYFISTPSLNDTEKTQVVFSISDNKYAKIVGLVKKVKTGEIGCKIKANEKNLLTYQNPITLTVTYLDKEYTKEISIVPLW